MARRTPGVSIALQCWPREGAGSLSLRLAFAILIFAFPAVAQDKKPDLQWPMPARNFSNTRYSELDQIRSDNAKNLRLAWKFDTGVNRGQEAAPIIVDDTMYVVTPFPNTLYALDL